MSEVWKNIFKEWLQSYDALTVLSNNGLMDEEELLVYKSNLLSEIIACLRGEVEE